MINTPIIITQGIHAEVPNHWACGVGRLSPSMFVTKLSRTYPTFYNSAVKHNSTFGDAIITLHQRVFKETLPLSAHIPINDPMLHSYLYMLYSSMQRSTLKFGVCKKSEVLPTKLKFDHSTNYYIGS